MSTGNSVLKFPDSAKADGKLESAADNVPGSVSALPEIYVLGLSHKNASLGEREKFQLSTSKKEYILDKIKNSLFADEAVIFNTCNRVEIIWTSSKEDGAIGFIKDTLESIFPKDVNILPSIFYQHRGEEAVKHVFSVASSLDSLVIGESQIFGQVKNAYRFSFDKGLTGLTLNKLFEKSFQTAKKVRTETSISKGSLSVCSVAKDLALEVIEDLSEASLLVLGAGEMARLSLHYFKSTGLKKIFIANRSEKRGEILAKEFSAEYIPLEDFKSKLHSSDIILGAAELSENSEVFITQKDIENSLKLRKNQPQIVLDLAVPRNFSASLNLDNLFHFNIEQLQNVASDNLKLRSEELNYAKQIVDDSCFNFLNWKESYMLQPLIADASNRLEELRKQEVALTLKKFANKDYTSAQIEEVSQALDSFSQALISRALSQPLRSLKEEHRTKLSIFETFRRFFSE